jgi:hypothetical protein
MVFSFEGNFCQFFYKNGANLILNLFLRWWVMIQKAQHEAKPVTYALNMSK